MVEVGTDTTAGISYVTPKGLPIVPLHGPLPTHQAHPYKGVDGHDHLHSYDSPPGTGEVSTESSAFQVFPQPHLCTSCIFAPSHQHPDFDAKPPPYIWGGGVLDFNH